MQLLSATARDKFFPKLTNVTELAPLASPFEIFDEEFPSLRQLTAMLPWSQRAKYMGLARHHWKEPEWELKWLTREYSHELQFDMPADMLYLSHRNGLWVREGRDKSSRKVLEHSSDTFSLTWSPFFLITDRCWSVMPALREQFQLAPCALWQELRRASLNASPWSLPVFLLSPHMGQGDPSSQRLQATGLTYQHVFSLL